MKKVFIVLMFLLLNTAFAKNEKHDKNESCGYDNPSVWVDENTQNTWVFLCNTYELSDKNSTVDDPCKEYNENFSMGNITEYRVLKDQMLPSLRKRKIEVGQYIWVGRDKFIDLRGVLYSNTGNYFAAFICKDDR